VNSARSVAVLVPLLAWVAYIRWKVGPADQGFGNFTWPVIGWIEKWSDTLADYARQPDFRWLNTTTLLATVALTAQAAYFLFHRRRDNPWWRVGMSGVAMMALLGTAVWEGHPGAATRVLLPMGMAFALFAVRERAGTGWLLAGGLSVFSGVQALWHVPHDPMELAAGRFGAGSYIVRIDTGWYGTERHRGSAWAWCASEGRLAIETSPHTTGPLRVRLRVRAFAPREIELRDDRTVLWRGTVGTRLEWIEINATQREPGRLFVDFRSEAPPVREGDGPDARPLGFAVYDVEVRQGATALQDRRLE
jgi:hypothetical protein